MEREILKKEAGLLVRPHIDELLFEAVRSPVVTVIAGTGYGKTTALRSFVEKQSFKLIWMQLTKQDNYPIQFWADFVLAIEMFNPKFAEQVRKMGFPDSIEKVNQFLQYLADHCYSTEQVVLVFDDFHHIRSELIKNFIENIVITEIENLTMVFASRFAPEIDFYSLSDNMPPAKIGTEDLQFSLAEARRFFEMQGINVDEKMIHEIYGAAEGWPLALALSAMWLKKQDAACIEDTAMGAVPLVYDLIEQEIFDEYPAEVKRFFIKLSLLEDFSIDLLKEITKESFQQMVEALNRNMFVYFNMNSKTYSLHNLFVKFLERKQNTLSKAEVHMVYALAAKWYKAKNSIVEACTYYKLSHQYDELWKIMKTYGIFGYAGGITEFYLKLVDEFPEEYIRKNPLIRVFKAHLHIVMADAGKAHEAFLALEEEFLVMPDGDGKDALLGEVYIGLAHTSMIRKSYMFKSYYEKAIKRLKNGSTIIGERITYVGTHNALVLFSYGRGEMDKMLDMLFEVMPRAAKMMHGSAFGMEYLAAAEAAYFRGEMDDAEKNAVLAIENGAQMNQYDIVGNAYFMLMRVYAMKGDAENCFSFLKKLREYIQSLEHNDLQTILDVAEAWFYCMIGKPEKIVRWILDDRLNLRMHAPVTIGRDQIAKAFSLLKNKEYYELLMVLEEMDAFYQERGILLLLLQTRVLKALCLYKTGSLKKAFKMLQQTYNMAKGNNLVIFYVEPGNDMLAFLKEAYRTDSIRVPREWIGALLEKVEAFAENQKTVTELYEKEEKEGQLLHLTEHEKEILDDLCRGLTKGEIAERFNTSEYAIRNSLTNIYKKLGAINRPDAVRIARMDAAVFK